MKNIVINFTKCSAGSTIASNRIAKFISNKTGFLLVDDISKTEQLKDQQIGSVYVVNGLFGFCNFREECVDLCERANQLIWVGNDYNIPAPTQLKKFDFLKVCQYVIKDEILLDWNKLTYTLNDIIKTPIYNGLMYYGAFREKRLTAFERYFKNNIYEIYVSTSPKNAEKYQAINDKIKIMKPFSSLIEESCFFGNTIYIEDEMRKEGIFLTPANRFYECLSANILQMFDSNSIGSFADFKLDDYIVSNDNELKEKLNSKTLLNQQINDLKKRNYLEELNEEFEKFHNKYCKNLEQYIAPDNAGSIGGLFD